MKQNTKTIKILILVLIIVLSIVSASLIAKAKLTNCPLLLNKMKNAVKTLGKSGEKVASSLSKTKTVAKNIVTIKRAANVKDIFKTFRRVTSKTLTVSKIPTGLIQHNEGGYIVYDVDTEKQVGTYSSLDDAQDAASEKFETIFVPETLPALSPPAATSAKISSSLDNTGMTNFFKSNYDVDITKNSQKIIAGLEALGVTDIKITTTNKGTKVLSGNVPSEFVEDGTSFDDLAYHVICADLVVC